MMRFASFYAALATLLLSYGVAAAADADCAAARCVSQDAINAQCACDNADFTNHGSYVRCVAKVVNTLAREGSIPNNCKGRIRRCAAKSTCGKAGFVTCTVAVTGTCDVTAGTCLEGTLVGDLTACASDADCLVGTRCMIRSSADACPVDGVVGSGTCCADCLPPAP